MWLGAAVGRSAISKQAPVTLIAECALVLHTPLLFVLRLANV
jgi:hypothetical protein